MRIALPFALAAAVIAMPIAVIAQEDEEGTDQPWEQEKKKDPKPAKSDEGAPEAGAKQEEKPAPKPAKQEKGKKGKGGKDGDAPAPPQGFKGSVVEETHDYIRCKDEVYQNFLQAREEYTALKRQQTNLLSIIHREQKTLDQIKGLAEDEIEPEVRTLQVQALQKTIDEMQEKLKKLEPRLMEKLYKYEPLRSKCED